MNPSNEPTALLSAEHKNIMLVINALEKESDELVNGKEIDKDFFEKAIDFIKNYADKFHHAKEENILFVELCKDEVEMHCNPTEQMLHEHDLGRGFVKGMEEGLEENDKNKLAQSAMGYADLLREHIFKEDNILYPMAVDALSEDMKNTMLDKFEEVEQKFGEERERLLSIVSELEDRD